MTPRPIVRRLLTVSLWSNRRARMARPEPASGQAAGRPAIGPLPRPIATAGSGFDSRLSRVMPFRASCFSARKSGQDDTRRQRHYPVAAARVLRAGGDAGGPTRTRGMPSHLRAISSGVSRHGLPMPNMPAITPMLRIRGAVTRRRSSASTNLLGPRLRRIGPGRITFLLADRPGRSGTIASGGRIRRCSRRARRRSCIQAVASRISRSCGLGSAGPSGSRSADSTCTNPGPSSERAR